MELFKIIKSAEDAKTRIEFGRCPFCNKPVDLSEIRDGLSLKEYTISGLCQKCQDKTFGEDNAS
jgi:hypothetical protein